MKLFIKIIIKKKEVDSPQKHKNRGIIALHI